jgi:acylphosphatase
MIARRYIIRGRVQGVGFRWYAEREAGALGIVGWVRNNEDGTVECLAAGPEERLQAFGERLAAGPRASRVDVVEETEAAPEDLTGYLRSFQILGGW